MKQKLVFDVTDAPSIDASDNVGAWIRAGSDGDRIASQTINSEEWLNTASVLYDDAGAAINDANPLAVSVKDGVNVEVDLDAGDDSVAAWLNDGSGNAIGSTGGALDVNISNANVEVTQGTSPWVVGDGGGSLTVDATALDIRALTNADVVTAEQGTDPWVVSATDLDIRSLDHSSGGTNDSVRLGDGTDLMTSTLAGGKQALDVYIAGNEDIEINDAALADTAIATAAPTLAVANTAQDAVASPLANRKYLFIMNTDNREMFIGPSGVSAANGFPVNSQVMLELRAGPSIDIEFVSSKVGHEIRTMELS